MANYKIVIVGGGTAGLSVSALLLNKNPKLDIAIIDPADKHYYQPIWTLVGAGVFPKEDSMRDEADYIPAGATWIKEYVEEFDPDNNQVILRNGEKIGYEYLVVGAGIQINWDAIPGLKESVGKPGTGVCSNYAYETVDSTWDNLRSLKKGTAIFTQPATPIKCGGAPQKITYLAADHLRKMGIRDQVEVIFASAGKGIFSVPKYAKTLKKVVERHEITTKFRHNLLALKPEEKIAIFENLEDGSQVELHYDMIHVTPPQGPMDFIKNSPIANEAGWVSVDKETLQHINFANIFSLGDCSNLPTSKTGAAIRKQAPVLVENLLAVMSGNTPGEAYDGYTSCPVVTGYGSLVLAEFDYDGNPKESFPFDQSKERYSMYVLKAYGLPRMYWHGMLRGREF